MIRPNSQSQRETIDLATHAVNQAKETLLRVCSAAPSAVEAEITSILAMVIMKRYCDLALSSDPKLYQLAENYAQHIKLELES